MSDLPVGGLVKTGFWFRGKFRNWRNKVRVRKGEKPKGSKMAINLGTRTSTNALVGGGVLSTIYVQVVGMLPWEGLVGALTTPEAIALVATGFAWLVARLSKTPEKPGVV